MIDDLFAIDDDDEVVADFVEPAWLENVNDAQRQAITTTEGPLLILAGAGTGKTMVLTSRIAWILQQKLAAPYQVLAVTFTNKAANEMKERISNLTEGKAEWLWSGTFHAIASRILRRHAELVGLKSDYIILGVDDCQRIIKQLAISQNIDEKKLPARLLYNTIQSWKDKVLTPQMLSTQHAVAADARIVMLYEAYQQKLKELNAVDFGDLLLLSLEIFQKHSDILQIWQNKFKYILVDEYQDTNIAQYLWLRLLAVTHGNICCVGDDDQSIYSWRGAEVGNILRFEDDFKNAKLIRLEQNYRSTGHILSAASSIIDNNGDRLGKTLWTDIGEGEKVVVTTCKDSDEEARMVAIAIENLVRSGEKWSSNAILVRTTAQMLSFEECLIQRAIPYKVIGGARFYERQEIRDAIAYIRLVASPSDDLAFERIINLPKRGVGNVAMQKIRHYAQEQGISLYNAMVELLNGNAFSGKCKSSLEEFVTYMQIWQQKLTELPCDDLVTNILEDSGYFAMWQQDKSPESQGRLENLRELVGAVAEFETIGDFLEHIALVMDTDEEAGGDKVVIMTLHGAKGLEFDNVFLPGWEEGLFPNQRALDDGAEQALEEERRLAYVAITRGKKRVVIFYCHSRKLFGYWKNAIASRFIDELPEEHIINRNLYKENHKKRFSLHKHEGYDRTREVIDYGTSGLKKGALVNHKVFGDGHILEVDGNKLRVAFEDGQVKNLAKGYVTLKK